MLQEIKLAARALLEAVRARFGSVCASVSPDLNFRFRCLADVDSILFYDASPIKIGAERPFLAGKSQHPIRSCW